MSLLNITNLSAKIGDKQILNGLNLTINQGEIHAIMGQNGAGKSSLAQILAGKQDYEVNGAITLKSFDLLAMNPEERALNGLFMAFQYPIEIAGLSYSVFLRHAKNAHCKFLGKSEYDPMSFVKYLKQQASALGISDEMLRRSVNVGFSGGEKKRMEVLQINICEPDLIILDETDSGLDVSALKLIAENINQMKQQNPTRSFIIITHYLRLLEYIEPNFVHILQNGKISQTGDKNLAIKLDELGYEGV